MKMLGIEALNGGDAEGAITHLTKGIQLDCKKTALFIKRATYVLTCFIVFFYHLRNSKMTIN